MMAAAPGAVFQETRCATYDLAVEIAAPAEVVWRTLIDEPQAWWLPDYHCAGEGSVVSLEARAGGRLLETHPDGSSLLWFTVQWYRPAARTIHFYGHASPEWGGPSTSSMRWRVVETSTGSRLEVQDSVFGVVSEAHLASMQEGWLVLFRDGLKQVAEARR